MPRLDDPSGHDRRRLLRQAGIAAGTAWVAPAILSATPAWAGAASGDPCTPTVVAISRCVEGRLVYGYTISVDPLLCPDGVVLEGFRSVDGGPFSYVVCTIVNTSICIGDFGTETTAQVRWDWKTLGSPQFCAGTVIQSFLSPVFGPCVS